MYAKLRIHRFVEGRKWTQDYSVEVKTGMTILEALITIKEQQDPTLAFTSSCRSSICGACAVRVNGNAVLACETLVTDQMDTYDTNILTIEPLGNFEVIRDLVVNWDQKYERMKKIDPAVEPKDEFSADTGCRQSPEDFEKYKKYALCILCGSCVSECNKNSLNQKDFLDPFAFVKGEKIVSDSRDKSPKEHLQRIVDAGLWACFNCEECRAS